MSVLGWIVVGLLAGGIGRRVVGLRRMGCLTTLVVGVIGACIGGGLYRLASGSSTDVFNDFDLGSIAVATIGAVAFLLVLVALDGSNRRS